MVIERYKITAKQSNWRTIVNTIKIKLEEFLLQVIPENGMCINHQEISKDNKAITYKVYNSSRKQIGELRFRVELV